VKGAFPTRILATALWTALALLPAIASARSFTFDDYLRIVKLSDARIAPDGKHIVLVAGHTNAKEDAYDNQLVLVDVSTGKQRAITHERSEVGDPQWSPDGTQLAFVDVAGNDKDAAPQVWILPMNGGDAQAVTHAKNGVEVYAWRPDGKALAYVSPDDRTIPTPYKQNDLFHVGDDSFMTRSLPVPSHIWLQSLDGGNAQRLTEGGWSVYADTISWSADGTRIAFDRLPGARFDDILHSRVAVVDVSSKQVRVLSDRWSLLPAYAPSGDQLAFSQAHDRTIITEQDPVIASHDGTNVTNSAPALDRDVSFIDWMPDGKTLLVSADDRVTHALWFVRNGVAQRIDLGSVNFQDGSVAHDGAIAFIGSTSTNPGELYYLAPRGGMPVKLTTFNAQIAALDLAPAREFSWHNDGFTEYGPLTYPVGYQAGKKYPLVLVIHGGPTSEASTTAFNPLVQVLASRGAFVLQPNYRGSDDFGFAYAYAVVGNSPPAGAGRDCVAAVKALEASGMIDASRVGVSGWSAGGWLTSWLITHYDLWKAAVTGAAVDDAVLQYSLSQIDSYMEYLFGGVTPWKAGGLDVYRRSSPVTYAANVNAATLILSDTGDPRVPTPEAYEFYSALRDLGKTVEFVAVPANGHHPSDPIRSRAVDEVWADWMTRYLPLP
jgi:dipeptidyl aminopeptidase/acylaminoacyl peptidase